ncbi:MAG TPA: hypothetical protein VGR35_13705 [Tepidisphaeraceae bacterium]|nr:hypothetical protein [Tepidisphaeraceae bacterium]
MVLSQIAGGVLTFVGLVLVALVILWIILPFYVFDIAGKLSLVLEELQKTNSLLTQLNGRNPVEDTERSNVDSGQERTDSHRDG